MRGFLLFLVFFPKMFSQTLDNYNHSKKTYSENQRAVLAIYQHSNYGGESDGYILTKIKKLEDWNDAVSSIQILDGYIVKLFEHENFEGREVVLNKNVKDLKILNINDKISSLIIKKDEGEIIGYIYDNKNHSGNYFPLVRNSLEDLSQQTWLNDKVSSIQFGKKYFLEIYEHSDYRG